jgi:hypothetical protein
MRNLVHGQINMLLALAMVFTAALVCGVAGTLLTRDIVFDHTITVAAGSEATTALEYGVWPELANANFFAEVKEGFINEGVQFVEANLTTMQLSVYDQGVLVADVPIKSKGKEGSWWETPSGLYRAEGKERTHYSSFGHVYMPYSIPFQGNFFIHGWPYYEDGTPVASTYSGGCIRLADEHAKVVYGLISVGTPILVFEDEDDDSFSYTLDVPAVSAAGYLVADLDTNFVLLSGGINRARETALAAKLMTALVASEYKNIEASIAIPAEFEDDPVLASQHRYTLYELLFPLLRNDSDVAATAIAREFGEAHFVRLLEAKAEAIGMRQTRLSDATGKAGYSASTPEDLFMLVKYLNTNRPFVLSMSAGETDTSVYGVPRFGLPEASHPFSTADYFFGGAYAREYAQHDNQDSSQSAAAVQLAFRDPLQKGGSKDLISILEVPFSGESRKLAFIVLDSDDPIADTKAMRTFVHSMYH